MPKWKILPTVLAIVLLTGWLSREPIPQPAKEFNLTKQSFSFNPSITGLSKVDVNNTKAPGFQIYVSNIFPDTILGGDPADICWHSSSPTALSLIGLSGGAVSFSANASDGCSTFVAQTVYSNGLGSHTLGGQDFGPAFYIEVRYQYDPNLYSGGGICCGWPTLFAFSSQWLVGLSAGRTVEPDFMENYDPQAHGQQVATHDWDTSTNPNTNSQVFTATAVDGNIHVAALRKIPMSLNGGTGRYDYYLDGKLISSVTYTAGGQFSNADTHRFPLMINAGINDPIKIYRIEVWELP